MQYRTLGKTDINVSILGFGAMRLPLVEAEGKRSIKEEANEIIEACLRHGINYFDTGYTYCEMQSESFLGRVLKPYREIVYISTKFPLWLCESRGDFLKILKEQLKRLQTDWIDIYYFHNLTRDGYKNKFCRFFLLDEAMKAKTRGLVKHLGFSCHDSPEFMIEIMNEKWPEVLLCQYNLLDTKNEVAMKYAKDNGIGVVIMGPVGGGRLAVESSRLRSIMPPGINTIPEFALKFVYSNSNITCALSGMQSVTVVEENARIASKHEIIPAGDIKRILETIAGWKIEGGLKCTGCKYCMPCPNGIDIPYNFYLFELYKIYDLKEYALTAYSKMKPEKRAEKCIKCGVCEDKCPQKINISFELEKVVGLLGK